MADTFQDASLPAEQRVPSLREYYKANGHDVSHLTDDEVKEMILANDRNRAMLHRACFARLMEDIVRTDRIGGGA